MAFINGLAGEIGDSGYKGSKSTEVLVEYRKCRGILKLLGEQRRGMKMWEVPEDWKTANVVPLFKKGGRNKPGNYKPASFPSVVGKLLEKILKDGINLQLERRGLIRDSQHGFVRERSYLTNMVEPFKEVFKCIDEGSAVDVVYMDFSKAFDEVPRGRLIKKVKEHGIRSIDYKSREDVLELYRTLARPQLEYYVQFRKDMIAL
eukprot:g37605.t1